MLINKVPLILYIYLKITINKKITIIVYGNNFSWEWRVFDLILFDPIDQYFTG